jgi:hypothetical protein
MSTTLGFATARKTSRGNLVEGWLSGGSVQVYTSPRPSTADIAISTQTLLATITLPNPAGTVTNGVFTSVTLSQVLVSNTGSAVWCRVIDSVGATIFDGDVGTVGSGSFLETTNTSLTQGAYLAISSFTITEA